MANIYIAGPRDTMVEDMFASAEGYSITSVREESDLVCFTGGEDISPSLYGEEVNGAYGINLARDMQEVYEYRVARRLGLSMVGICRGAQFLNVMNGGKLKQHIEGHNSRYGWVENLNRGVEVKLLEDHHQGMIPTDDAHVIGVDVKDRNPEIIWYEKSNCLCFQAHPEWGDEGTKGVFFDLLESHDRFL